MNTSRRNILKLAGLTLAGSSFPSIIIPSKSFAGINGDTLKVGLIGCGGRGSGAAKQALSADPNVVLYAMGDIFSDKLETSFAGLKKIHGEKVKVDESRKFIGFDAFKKVIDSGVDVVLLATPPGFRPLHLVAAVQAGKHIFCEKPVAVDSPGVKEVMAAAKLAKQKSLSIVSGFCWRYDEPKRASFSRILDGAIGDVTTVYNAFNTGLLWSHPRKEGWKDIEFQLRNWLYYSWLSGDHIVEQAVHCIDMMSWAFGGLLPESAIGTGGRQVRTDPLFGHIYDHFAITYEYPDGKKGFHFSRQQANTDSSYLVESLGTKGRAIINCSRRIHEISGATNWKYSGPTHDMYQNQHNELFASIRNGNPINDGEWMCHSTLLAIMGRIAAYTGKKITWAQAVNSTEKLGPDSCTWDTNIPVAEVAKPGFTTFS